ncbi:MAG: PAS domain S-box protein [Candidatus Thermoplasmatota archaeon]|nr:PAS domain S-box protein [Candidatus Thermoplasmatota archaeon]
MKGNQDIKNISTTKTDQDLKSKIAELSVLYEIANLSFEGSLEDFTEEAMKKAKRLFAIYGFALLKGKSEERTTIACERFWDEKDVKEKIEENKDNQFIYHLGEDGDMGIIFMEQREKIEFSERRLYTIFGKQVEDGLALAESIRERQKAEEKELLLENMKDQVWYLKDPETYGRVNEAHADFLGVGKSEIENKNLYEIMSSKKEAKPLIEGNKKVFEEKATIKTEEWVQNGEGEKRLLSITKTPKMVDGKVKYVICSARDITERKEAEKHLEQSKNKIERLDEIGAEIQTCDSEEEVYSLAVKAAEDILDFDICSFDAVEGDMFLKKEISSSTPEDGYTDRRIKEGGLDSRTYLNQESYLVDDLSGDKDAKPVKSEYRSALSVPVGEYGVFQAVSKETGHFEESDLNTAKLLISHVREALDRIQVKKREEFLHSLLRHDVGNKNKIVKGYLKLMKDHDLPDEVKDFVEKSEHVVEESTEIIEKTRKLKKIEEEENIGEVNLNSVLDKVLSDHQDQLEDKGIKLDIEDSDHKVKGGPLLEGLFSNLVSNAVNHSDCDEIRIASQTEDDECVVTVEDNGVGIPDEMKEKIFEKGFKKGDNAGTGLGLYMIKEIAKSYDGSVEVKDSNFGGARFEIHLERLQ